MNRHSIKICSRSWGLSIVFALFIFFCAACPQLAYADGIKLVKVGEHYEPELRSGPIIILPETDIRAGIYQYIVDDVQGNGRIGFLKDENFYFVEESVSSYIASIISPPYFLVNADYGGSGGSGALFLFKFDKTEVKLLDTIGTGSAEKYGWSLAIELNSDRKNPNQDGPVYGKIGDINHDGIPEIEVLISSAFHFDPSFMLYFDIAGDKLRLNLSPTLYLPLFESEKQKTAQTEKKSDAFYIYGFLTKQLALKAIATELKTDNERKWIINFLNDSNKWNTAFHDQGEITMEKINLGGLKK